MPGRSISSRFGSAPLSIIGALFLVLLQPAPAGATKDIKGYKTNGFNHHKE